MQGDDADVLLDELSSDGEERWDASFNRARSVVEASGLTLLRHSAFHYTLRCKERDWIVNVFAKANGCPRLIHDEKHRGKNINLKGYWTLAELADAAVKQWGQPEKSGKNAAGKSVACAAEIELRDYFAAAALQGMCGCQDFLNDAVKVCRDKEEACDSIARYAYKYADAMLDNRELDNISPRTERK